MKRTVLAFAALAAVTASGVAGVDAETLPLTVTQDAVIIRADNDPAKPDYAADRIVDGKAGVAFYHLGPVGHVWYVSGTGPYPNDKTAERRTKYEKHVVMDLGRQYRLTGVQLHEYYDKRVRYAIDVKTQLNEPFGQSLDFDSDTRGTPSGMIRRFASPARARYVRLRVRTHEPRATPGAPGDLHITEIRLFDRPLPRVTATELTEGEKQDEQAIYSPDNLIDGVIGAIALWYRAKVYDSQGDYRDTESYDGCWYVHDWTGWSRGWARATIDLGGTYTVAGVRVYDKNGKEVQFTLDLYDDQYPDGRQVASGYYATGELVEFAAPMLAKAMRISVRGGGHSVGARRKGDKHITELQILVKRPADRAR